MVSLLKLSRDIILLKVKNGGETSTRLRKEVAPKEHPTVLSSIMDVAHLVYSLTLRKVSDGILGWNKQLSQARMSRSTRVARLLLILACTAMTSETVSMRRD